MSDDFDVRDDAGMDAWLRREGQAARAGRAGCPHPDALLARRSEFVAPEVRARIDAHIAGCEACARLVTGFDGLHLDEADPDAAARVLARVTVPRSTGVGWLLPVAAGIVLVVGAAIWWRTASPPSVAPQIARVSRPSAARPAPAGASPVVALWAIDPYPVTLALSSLDASRGASQSPRAPSRDLVDALLTYEHGEYAKAAEQLTAVTTAHPDAPDAWLYLGVAQLMADRPADAIAPLERAARDAAGERKDAIDWYLASAEQRTGQAGRARARLEDLCRGSGPFRTHACDAQHALR
jgi:tetratricopeptide repeat protein